MFAESAGGACADGACGEGFFARGPLGLEGTEEYYRFDKLMSTEADAKGTLKNPEKASKDGKTFW